MQSFGHVIVPPGLYTWELSSILENKVVGYADDSTLLAVVSSPSVRVAESQNHGLSKVKAETHCAFLQ